MALTSFYYVSWEILLGNSKELICIDQSRFYVFSHQQEFKNVTSKYFSFFNNKPSASWVAHITGDFLHVIPVHIIVPWWNKKIRFVKWMLSLHATKFCKMKVHSFCMYKSLIKIIKCKHRFEKNLFIYASLFFESNTFCLDCL